MANNIIFTINSDGTKSKESGFMWEPKGFASNYNSYYF